MPCMKCANGKWKYGARGRCQFDTKKKCEEAAAAIHAKDILGNSYDTLIIDECPAVFEQPPQPYLDRKAIDGKLIQDDSKDS